MLALADTATAVDRLAVSGRARILIAYFDAGGGHRAAANALRSVVEEQGRAWDIELVNLQTVLDSIDPFLKVTGIRLQDLFNRTIGAGWTLGARQMLPVLHGIIRARHRAGVRALARFWTEQRPDVLVSVVPNLNRTLAESLRTALPGVPFVTVLTDLADLPPHFWMERESEHIICGTERAAQQAEAMGHGTRTRRVSGMILHPKFYEAMRVERAQERATLGLRPDVPTALVLFGGQGSRRMRVVAESLRHCRRVMQAIFICGHNEKLAAELRTADLPYPNVVIDFTKEVPRYMAISDFFIGKPGPASVSEAVHMGLPVIVERNAWTLPQERYNAEWIEEKGVGLVLGNFNELGTAVDRLLNGSDLQALQVRTRGIRNRAVFEIPEVLDGILRESQHGVDRITK